MLKANASSAYIEEVTSHLFLYDSVTFELANQYTRNCNTCNTKQRLN